MGDPGGLRPQFQALADALDGLAAADGKEAILDSLKNGTYRDLLTEQCLGILLPLYAVEKKVVLEQVIILQLMVCTLFNEIRGIL